MHETSSNAAGTAWFLGVDDPLWLRLWTVLYHPEPRAFDMPITPEECAEHGLATNPWPVVVHQSAPAAPNTPSRTLEGSWSATPRGDKADNTVYLDRTRVLYVADSRQGRRHLERERMFLENIYSRHLPTVLGNGYGWLVTTRLEGAPPSQPGPWLRDLRMFLHELHTLNPSGLPRVRRPRLSALGGLLNREDALRLNGFRLDARDLRPSLVPTHGTLYPSQLRVRDNLRLIGVLDFTQVASAPVERDIASMMVRLAPLTGVLGLRKITCETPDPWVLASEFVDLLEIASRKALYDDAGRAARIATIRYLARMMLDDPGSPARLLTLR